MKKHECESCGVGGLGLSFPYILSYTSQVFGNEDVCLGFVCCEAVCHEAMVACSCGVCFLGMLEW